MIICVLACRIDFIAPILVITCVYFSYFSLKMDPVRSVCGGGKFGQSGIGNGFEMGVITDDPVEKKSV